MSTRCYIGRVIDSDKLEFVYCHHDGYINHVGKILYENYNDEEKIDDLFANGDMSSIGKTIKDCDFYKDVDSKSFTIRLIDLFSIDDYPVDYIYIYGTNHWVVCNTRNGNFNCLQLKDYFEGDKKNE